MSGLGWRRAGKQRRVWPRGEQRRQRGRYGPPTIPLFWWLCQCAGCSPALHSCACEGLGCDACSVDHRRKAQVPVGLPSSQRLEPDADVLCTAAHVEGLSCGTCLVDKHREVQGKGGGCLVNGSWSQKQTCLAEYNAVSRKFGKFRRLQEANRCQNKTLRLLGIR